LWFRIWTCQDPRVHARLDALVGWFGAATHANPGPGGTVASGDHGACGIVRRGGILQIASRSSSNAVASRNTGGSSTPSSQWPQCRLWMNACPLITTLAVRSVFNPRIGRSRALSLPWSHSRRLFSYSLVLWNAAGINSSITFARAGARSSMSRSCHVAGAMRAKTNPPKSGDHDDRSENGTSVRLLGRRKQSPLPRSPARPDIGLSLTTMQRLAPVRRSMQSERCLWPLGSSACPR
jgi:hypothetical protein